MKQIQCSANLDRLIEIANWGFGSINEAECFLKGMVVTALEIWFKKDKDRTEEDEIILCDTLAALIYVME